MVASVLAGGCATTTGAAAAAGCCEYHQYPPPEPAASKTTIALHRGGLLFGAWRKGMGRAAARGVCAAGIWGARGGVMGFGVICFRATAAAAAGAASADPIRSV